MAESKMLQKHLILNRFFCHLFGCDDFKGLREKLRDQKEGEAEDGHSHFFHVLAGLQGIQVPLDKLTEHDLRIKGYIERLNRSRTPPVQLKYFQYLAVLFTEIYLDRLFDGREAFLIELNDFAARVDELSFSDDDLSKIAYWMATGSGKTLIMHINLWQILRHVRSDNGAGKAWFDNVLLVTPNEGLSRQHLEEFHKSGIVAHHHNEIMGGEIGLGSHGNAVVRVIEITKLTTNKRGRGLSVEVDSFGSNNLLFVDEGHRGASGEVWRVLRKKLAENGFACEYSATFGQIVNGASEDKRPDLLEEYSKAILFDYSYPHFYQDGYGKDYWIVNLHDNTDTFNDWLLLSNLLSFYEQCLVYAEHLEAFRPYNVEKPLWVFVGHTVTGGKTRDDKTSIADVEQIILFFNNFLRRSANWIEKISKLLAGNSGLRNQRNEDLFKDLFLNLRNKGSKPSEIYNGILHQVFHGQTGETLRAVQLKTATGEIGLRAGMDKPYFGVINIGDVAGLIKLLAERGISCDDDNINGSLFDEINSVDSTVKVLIGSRKFMEGWDSFRVASLGLMNIGKGEGAQIIQLFGRGVRLWGKERSLKRSSALPVDDAPAHMKLLETINIFGVRANYMAQFREYLKQEGIETELEKVVVKIRPQAEFFKRGLQVLRLPEDEKFQDQDGVVVTFDQNIKVILDLRPRFEAAKSETDEEIVEVASAEDKADDLKKLLPLLDLERVYFDLLHFKQGRRLHNLSFTKETLQTILRDGNYTVLSPNGHLSPKSFDDLRRAEEIAAAILRKYTASFFDRKRRAWEKKHLRLMPLNERDPNVNFGSYEIRVTKVFAEKVRKLLQQGDELYRKDMTEFPNIHFDRHVYQPLLLADERIESMTPAGLNVINRNGRKLGEAQFIRHLRDYLCDNVAEFEGKEIFLLRNLTRGKGIGLFDVAEGESFYPDFILWIIEHGKQWITFIDPHGLAKPQGGFDNPKIRLHKEIRELESELQSKLEKWEVRLASFIISTSAYDAIQRTFGTPRPTRRDFERNHVLFQEDDEYVCKMFRVLLTEPH